ncbi:two-component sensor histidine kinase [Burkholderia ubonensis]|uniref:ATP-binding protein n=1 Tax=Burkholderia ubonensis TaxID=101571 RepID=UPI000BA7D38D|nr:ATP-binding protein [Burkholderia ubonensis]PAK11630.1 two-component sensor histidine kinase [Burkholderia ubonensis]RQP91731.1 HAMP domain-containing protein [Burkholderia ubonensis]
MRRLLSTTLGQILTILGFASLITALLFIVLLSYHTPLAPPWPWQSAYRIVSLVEILQAMPDHARDEAVKTVPQPGLSVRLVQTPGPCDAVTQDSHDLETVLKSELPDTRNLVVRACPLAKQRHPIQVLVPLGARTLEIGTGPTANEPPPFTFPFYGALIFMCVGVAAMSAWAIARVIRPLRRLSEQADAFGQAMSAAPIEEEGPLEVRRAAHAFNLMQERITQSIQNRTRMLAAISHDLRTPLTRMRLQLEMEQTEIIRDKLIRNIDLMQSMVSSALAFLSSGTELEEKEWLDLGALVATLCDEYEEAGATIRYDGPDKIPFFCRPAAMQRALANLIENAIHFGSSVEIVALTVDSRITIQVIDNGPGIPEQKLEDVIEPFVRLDPTRRDRPGSVGLGLSIVREIVHAHGGTFSLSNRKPSGLVAKITFPASRNE